MPSDQIPVTFTYQSKEYKGFLSSVSGRAAITYDLIVDGFFWGSLIYVEGSPGFGPSGLHAVPSGWRFNSPTMDLGYLADEFGRTVEAAVG